MNDKGAKLPQYSIEDRAKRFLETKQTSQPIVFCVTCGSANVGQAFIYKIQCFDCNTTSDWDATMFAIAREGSPDDALDSFRGPRGKLGTWYGILAEETHGFARLLTSLTQIAASPEPGLSPSDLERLRSEWERAKSTIDEVVAKIEAIEPFA